MRKALILATSLSALAMAGAANAAETDDPVALSDWQMDRVVAGVMGEGAGVVIVGSGEGAIVIQGSGNSSWPPPTVLVDHGEGFEWVNEAGVNSGP